MDVLSGGENGIGTFEDYLPRNCVTGTKMENDDGVAEKDGLGLFQNCGKCSIFMKLSHDLDLVSVYHKVLQLPRLC